MKKITLIILSVLFVCFLIYCFIPKAELKTFTDYSTAIFDAKGKLLRITLAQDDRYRLYESIANISPQLISATLLYEDQSYYSHSGVDYLALLRAFWTTYILNQRRIGASTITMQLARLRWNIPSHTLSGKFHQILRAIQLTRHYSKDEILEMYLNLAPYGRNIEGVAAASLIYFNKKPSELSLPEALTLAVIPQNPNKRNPTTFKGYDYLLQARANLWQRWLEYYPQDIDRQVYFDMPLNVRSPNDLPFTAPHFVNHIKQKLSRWESGYIYTTLDSQLQKIIEGIARRYIASKSRKGINNTAAVLIDYRTMELKAMLGSVDFYNNSIQGQVNGALAKRSPGSTLKPFVYALAFDEGLIHPMSLMKDARRRFAGFTPENYDRRFLGPVLAKDALIKSRNVPAVYLQSRLQKKSLYDFLKQANVKNLKAENFYGLALSLGGVELSMIELTGLYAGLANHGVFQEVNLFQNIADQSQYVSKNKKQLMSAEAGFMVLDILKNNPQPGTVSGIEYSHFKNDVAWKTGTSWAYRDAWAIGVSGPYVLAVWVGNFNGKGNTAFIGRSAAGPLLFSIFNAILPATAGNATLSAAGNFTANTAWKIEELISDGDYNLKKVEVCRTTGDLISPYCPQSTQSWFIPGVSPIKVSNIYRQIPIEKKSGLRACWHQPGKTQMRVFEFWPSDFLQIFQQAGISLKTPPGYLKACDLDQKSSSGILPVITSPQTSIEYVIESDEAAKNQIPFMATVDPDVEKLYWFVNGKYEGASEKGEAFIWQAGNGRFKVRVVDDAGRAASSVVKVLMLH
ncbi:Multimodular transpeptidase-transglycosylase [hydrothermal vent metagenome]|uniref:peptidoglycan glycosyltransferase n=1 Tax=hydrothermal vent metagenome TaxID=652676 RepID=A0A3B0X8H7_9ZZZZ